jgi:uncharacterized membrane protein
MNIHIIILILALGGIGESLYLNYERRRERPPVCVIGHDCGEVWASPYSKTFGVSNEILGIVLYATAAVIEWTLFLGNGTEAMIIGESLVLIAGAIMSCYFVYLQWRVIKAWCFWCTLSAIITWVMFLVHFIF